MNKIKFKIVILTKWMDFYYKSLLNQKDENIEHEFANEIDDKFKKSVTSGKNLILLFDDSMVQAIWQMKKTEIVTCFQLIIFISNDSINIASVQESLPETIVLENLNLNFIRSDHLKTLIQKRSQTIYNREEGQPEIGTPFIGRSEYFFHLKILLNKVAATDARVLITGESGTGKEVVANHIHSMSNRAEKPFYKVNCASIPDTLLESELFGYEKGAFTGAVKSKKGKFELVNHGTLLLDEIGDMPILLQPKLLRVIQENKVERLGGTTAIPLDIRIISATNKSIHQLSNSRTFRNDLFHRLNVVHIHIPPLRERKEDIVPLSHYYLKIISKKYHRKVKHISKKAEKMMLSYSWPGNVRELINFIEKIVLFEDDKDELSASCVFDYLSGMHYKKMDIHDILDGDITLKEAKEYVERELISRTLKKTNWKISKTAQILGIDRTNLFRKMKKYGFMNIMKKNSGN